MKTLKQLIRQPVKTLCGLLVVSLAVAVLCVCIGQSVCATATADALDDRFLTIALTDLSGFGYGNRYDGRPTLGYRAVLFDQVAHFVDELEANHPELVKTVANPGLASAYIPQLQADNLSHHLTHTKLTFEGLYATAQEVTPSYACAIMEIVVTEIGEVLPWTCVAEKEDGTKFQETKYFYVLISGTIESVLSLESGYDDPTGRVAHITLQLPAEDSLSAMDIEVGGRYLVYTSDYQDGEWLLKSTIANNFQEKQDAPIDWVNIETDNIEFLDSKQLAYLNETQKKLGIVAAHRCNYGITHLDATQAGWKDAAVLTVRDPSSFGKMVWVKHENGRYLTWDYTRYITDENGNQTQISEEAWQARYAQPTMARIEGTVEDFLASEEGAIWRQYLEYSQINYHAFPIIGVEKLGYIADFARNEARIVAGRDFTAQELESGAKVCILSESLAAANGLSVGDTVSPRFYNYDWSDPGQVYLSDSKGTINPSAYLYSANTDFAGEAESYIIVGLYRQSNAWGKVSENPWTFTPNTIFVPHSAVPSDMDYGNQGFFQTLVLHNGKLEEFNKLVAQADCGGYFLCYDQGYGLVEDAIDNMRTISARMTVIGLSVYGVVIVLFLLLFPGSQRKTLRTMTALGVRRGQKLWQLVLSSLGILVPGTLVGLAAGLVLWDRVTALLAASTDSVLTLEMDPLALSLVALTQLLLALALTALLALPLSAHKSMRKGR